MNKPREWFAHKRSLEDVSLKHGEVLKPEWERDYVHVREVTSQDEAIEAVIPIFRSIVEDNYNDAGLLKDVCAWLNKYYDPEGNADE